MDIQDDFEPTIRISRLPVNPQDRIAEKPKAPRTNRGTNKISAVIRNIDARTKQAEDTPLDTEFPADVPPGAGNALPPGKTGLPPKSAVASVKAVANGEEEWTKVDYSDSRKFRKDKDRKAPIQTPMPAKTTPGRFGSLELEETPDELDLETDEEALDEEGDEVNEAEEAEELDKTEAEQPTFIDALTHFNFEDIYEDSYTPEEILDWIHQNIENNYSDENADVTQDTTAIKKCIEFIKTHKQEIENSKLNDDLQTKLSFLEAIAGLDHPLIIFEEALDKFELSSQEIQKLVKKFYKINYTPSDEDNSAIEKCTSFLEKFDEIVTNLSLKGKLSDEHRERLTEIQRMSAFEQSIGTFFDVEPESLPPLSPKVRAAREELLDFVNDLNQQGINFEEAHSHLMSNLAKKSGFISPELDFILKIKTFLINFEATHKDANENLGSPYSDKLKMLEEIGEIFETPEQIDLAKEAAENLESCIQDLENNDKNWPNILKKDPKEFSKKEIETIKICKNFLEKWWDDDKYEDIRHLLPQEMMRQIGEISRLIEDEDLEKLEEFSDALIPFKKKVIIQTFESLTQVGREPRYTTYELNMIRTAQQFLDGWHESMDILQLLDPENQKKVKEIQKVAAIIDTAKLEMAIQANEEFDQFLDSFTNNTTSLDQIRAFLTEKAGGFVYRNLTAEERNMVDSFNTFIADWKAKYPKDVRNLLQNETLDAFKCMKKIDALAEKQKAERLAAKQAVAAIKAEDIPAKHTDPKVAHQKVLSEALGDAIRIVGKDNIDFDSLEIERNFIKNGNVNFEYFTTDANPGQTCTKYKCTYVIKFKDIRSGKIVKIELPDRTIETADPNREMAQVRAMRYADMCAELALAHQLSKQTPTIVYSKGTLKDLPKDPKALDELISQASFYINLESKDGKILGISSIIPTNKDLKTNFNFEKPTPTTRFVSSRDGTILQKKEETEGTPLSVDEIRFESVEEQYRFLQGKPEILNPDELLKLQNIETYDQAVSFFKSRNFQLDIDEQEIAKLKAKFETTKDQTTQQSDALKHAIADGAFSLPTAIELQPYRDLLQAKQQHIKALASPKLKHAYLSWQREQFSSNGKIDDWDDTNSVQAFSKVIGRKLSDKEIRLISKLHQSIDGDDEATLDTKVEDQNTQIIDKQNALKSVNEQIQATRMNFPFKGLSPSKIKDIEGNLHLDNLEIEKRRLDLKEKYFKWMKINIDERGNKLLDFDRSIRRIKESGAFPILDEDVEFLSKIHTDEIFSHADLTTLDTVLTKELKKISKIKNELDKQITVERTNQIDRKNKIKSTKQDFGEAVSRMQLLKNKLEENREQLVEILAQMDKKKGTYKAWFKTDALKLAKNQLARIEKNIADLSSKITEYQGHLVDIYGKPSRVGDPSNVGSALGSI